MRKIISWLLTFAMIISLFAAVPQTVYAAGVTERYVYDAAALPDGTIGVLFIYGGSSATGIVTGGTLYYGVYDPDTNTWTQEPVAPGGAAAAAKDAAMALDSGGNPHIAYLFTNTNDEIGYTYYNGSTWAAPVSFGSNNDGGYTGTLSEPRLTVDSNGTAHIAYVDSQGNNLSSSYSRHPDLMYRSISDGVNSLPQTIIHGYCENAGGSDYSQQNIINRAHITGVGEAVYIGGAGRSRYGGASSWSGGYNIYPKPSGATQGLSLGYGNISASEKGFKLYGIAAGTGQVYSFYSISGTISAGPAAGLHIAAGVGTPALYSSLGASINTGDITTSGAEVYAAGINGTVLTLFQNAAPTTKTLTTAILSNHPRMATVVAGGTQYILYTGNDPEKSLFIASVPASGGELTEYQVPNKTAVVITGVTVDDKEYDGIAAAPGGTLAVVGAELTAGDLTYTYSSIDGGGYDSSTPPVNAGDYKLVISVPEDNPNYSGSSTDISFRITKKPLSVSGTAAVSRTYAPGNISVALDTASSVLAGVLEADASDVALNRAGAAGEMAEADAGSGKLVTVTGFTISGTAAGNYSLAQPTGVTVEISPLILSAPTMVLDSDNLNGGLSATITDAANTAGVDSYTVEIYREGNLQKTINHAVKDTAFHIPLESTIIVAESSYTAKAKAAADGSGNYADSLLGAESSSAVASYAPLAFADNASYDIPASQVDTPITVITVSGGVTGGKTPYSFSASGLPAWAQISSSGAISGMPAAAATGGTATVTVTDANSDAQSITIAYGATVRGNTLSFGGSAPPAAKTYGDASFDLALTYDGNASNVSYSVVSGPGSLSGVALSLTGAGDIVIRATGTSDNYETKIQDYTITVNKKPVTITPTATSNTKVYGQSDPEFAYTNTALVGEDALTGAILTRTSGENAGNYAISIAADAAANNPDYQLSLAGGAHNFVVSKKALTITDAVITGKAYDGTTSIEADDVTAVTLAGDLDGMVLDTDFETSSASYADPWAGADKSASIILTLKDTVKANNYTFESGEDTYTGATADITPAIQTITANNQTLTVTHTKDLTTIASSNAPAAVLSFAIDGGTSTHASLAGSVMTGTSAGTVTINIDSATVDTGGTPDPEYAAAIQKQIVVSISAKENGNDTITFSDRTIPYGESDIPDATTTMTGGAWSYSYSGTALDGSPYSGDTPPSKAGSYTVAATYENLTHIGSKSASLTISARTIAITGVEATHREYNGTTTVSITGGTLEGVEAGDTVTANVPVTGTIVSADAGSNKAVIVGAVTLDGSDKSNYTLIQPTGITVNIAPKATVFTVEAIPSQAYTGARIEPALTVRDGGTALTQNIDYSVNYGENINAGASAGTASVSGIGNYLGSSADVTFHINKADYTGAPVTGTKQVISNTADTGVTFDLSGLSFPAGFTDKSFLSAAIGDNASGLLAGSASITGNTLSFDVTGKAAGTTADIHVTVSSNNYNNYIAAVTVTTVDKTPAAITGVTVEGKVYDGTPVVSTGTPTNGDGYSGAYEYLYEGTGTTVYSGNAAPANAGNYKLTVRVPLTDPTFSGAQIVNFSITKATLTVKPRNESIYANDPLPATVVEYKGLQGSDASTIAALSSGSLDMEIKTFDGATALTNSAIIGSYAIKFTGMPVFQEADNYIIQTADGVLSINSRPSPGGGNSGPAPDPVINTGSGTVTQSQVINAIQAAEEGENIAVNVTGGSGNAIIPMAGIQAIAGHSTGLKIAAADAEIVLGADAVAGIAEEASLNDPVEFVVRRLENAAGNAEIAELISKTDQIFDISILIGGRPIHEPAGEFSLTFVCRGLAKFSDPRVIHLKNDGTREYFKPAIDGNRLTVSGNLSLSYFAVIDASDVPETMNFDDVPESAWHYTAVKYVIDNGLFTGTGAASFSPNAYMTRGMLVTVLYRIEGSPDTGASDFIDVKQGAWYAKAVAWADENNIISGYGNQKFGTKNPVTREQMATILYRYAVSAEVEVVTSGSLEGFTDGNKTSAWAADAMKWAVGNELITGKGGGILDPRGTATRAETAAILQRFVENVMK